MSKPSSPVSGTGSIFRSKALLSLGVLIFLVLVAIGMLFIPVRANSAELDGAALAHAVAEQCAIGWTSGKKTEVTAGLQGFFSGLKAGASVSVTDIGAIASKIAPTDQGVALFKVFTECLKTQTELMLSSKGVKVVSEAEKDELVRQTINDISPDTSREKLIEIFGQPVSSGSTENSDGMQVDIYRYKFSAFAFDYRSGSNRVAIVLSTKDPLYGQSMLFDQIAGIDIAEAYRSCDGVQITAHFNARSNICPASHATNYIAKIFLFQAVLTAQMHKEANLDECRKAESPDPNKCPGFASVPALGVALIKNSSGSSSADKRLTRVADAFLSEWDFSGGVNVLSPAEEKALEKQLEDESSMSQAQLDTLHDKQIAHRSKRYQALLRH